jgi:hypothetical protein
LLSNWENSENRQKSLRIKKNWTKPSTNINCIIYRLVHPRTIEYTFFFKCSWNTKIRLYSGPYSSTNFEGVK